MRRRAMPAASGYVIVIFRMLVLQSLYNLSDEQVEYRVRDRLSFTRFLRLGFEDGIPVGTAGSAPHCPSCQWRHPCCANVVGAFDHFESLFRRTKTRRAEAIDQN